MSKRKAPLGSAQPESKETSDLSPGVEQIAREYATGLLGHCDPHEIAGALKVFNDEVRRAVDKMVEKGHYLTEAAQSALDALD